MSSVAFVRAEHPHPPGLGRGQADGEGPQGAGGAVAGQERGPHGQRDERQPQPGQPVNSGREDRNLPVIYTQDMMLNL